MEAKSPIQNVIGVSPYAIPRLLKWVRLFCEYYQIIEHVIHNLFKANEAFITAKIS